MRIYCSCTPTCVHTLIQWGCHQSIRGNHQFFEADHTKVAGALNKLKSLGASSNIYVVLCGPMTPAQKAIVHNKSVLNTNLYLNLLRWFKAHHPGFADVELVCPEINLVEDAESPRNTDKEGDPVIETQCNEGVFYFTSGNEPRKETSVFKTTRELAMSILENRAAPTLVIQGGRYSRHNESRQFEHVMPIQFPFGSGGPTLNRPTPISDEELLRHYLKLSLPQFKKSDFVFLACQALRRITSYRSALLKCRPIIDANGTRMGEQISKMTVDDVKEAVKREEIKKSNSWAMLVGNSNGRDSVATKFLKAVNTSCRAFGTSVEAAEYAKRKCFSLQNYFGMHSLFLTITPDDQCCFRIRLYVNSKAKVSLSGL